MTKSLRSLVLVAGIASASAFGCNFALADTTAAAPAATQPQGEHRHGCDKGKGHWKRQRAQRFAHLAKALGLSDQQKAQAKAIFTENREQAKPLFTSMRSERHQLHQLIQSGSADEAAIRAQSAKVSALQADLAVQRAKGAKQLLALLTPDQQAKFKELQARREQKCAGFGNHGEGDER
jgi:periplasmic protein CpxP/Spy